MPNTGTPHDTWKWIRQLKGLEKQTNKQANKEANKNINSTNDNELGKSIHGFNPNIQHLICKLENWN